MIVLIAGVRPVRAPPSTRPLSTHEFFEGLRFVLQRKPVLGAISLDLFAVLFGGATALLPVFAADILHVGPVGLGTLRTAPGVGAALTAAFLATRPIERHAGRWMFGGVALFGVATIVFGALDLVPGSRSARCSCSVSATWSACSCVTCWCSWRRPTRSAAASARSARCSSAPRTSSASSRAGVTAKWFGTVPAVVFGGAACIGVVIVYLRLFPELRRLDRFPKPHA